MPENVSFRTSPPDRGTGALGWANDGQHFALVTTQTIFPAELLEAVAQRVAELLTASKQEGAYRPLLTVLEAADHLRCSSRQRVDDLLSQGRLTRVKDGRRTLIAREELDRYLAGEPTGRFEGGMQDTSRPVVGS